MTDVEVHNNPDPVDDPGVDPVDDPGVGTADRRRQGFDPRFPNADYVDQTDGMKAVFPELDGQGGTVFRTGSAIGEDPVEASFEDWSGNNMPLGTRNANDQAAVDAEDDGGSPDPADPNYQP